MSRIKDQIHGSLYTNLMAEDRFELETRLVVEQFELKSDNRIRLLARLVEKLEKWVHMKMMQVLQVL